jgi:hypothetical protein
MRYTAVFKLNGPLAKAAAVEWTAADAPETSGAGWEACVRLPSGDWRLASHAAAAAAQWRAPGVFGNIGLRYRLSASGPWSPVSTSRKEITLVDESIEPQAPDPAPEPEAPAAEPEPEAPAPEPEVPAPDLIAPMVLVAPGLAGLGRIGSELSVITGLWSGLPAPSLELQWQRDGRDIAGATDAVYVPGPADDRSALTCVVTARSAAGTAAAVAGPIAVTYPAPTAAGGLLEEIFDQGSGTQVVAAAADFTGEALRFAVTGADARIDAATGVVSIPTDAPRGGETVTVSASNSGGTAESAFRVTVEAAEVAAPPALGPEEWDVSWDLDPAKDGLATWHFAIKGGPALGATRLYWRGRAPLEGGPGTGFHACIEHPSRANVWIARANLAGEEADWLWVNSPDPARSILGQEKSQGLIYTLDPLEIPAGEALYSDYSDVKTKVVSVPAAAAPEASAVAAYRRAPYVTPAKARVNYPPSDNEQVMLTMARAPSEADRIYAGQDVGGVWVSADNGRKWNTLRNRGLGTPHILSLEVDPLDADRVVALCFRRVPKGDFTGLYRTLDGGLNWTYVFPWGDIGEPRGAQRKIAHAPSSTNGKYAARWYAAFDSAKAFASRDFYGVPGFVTSADGGETWTQVRDLPAATFGDTVNGIRVHPTQATVVYGWGSQGLFRFNEALKAAGSVEFLSGKGGLPAGKIYGDLYLSRDGRTLIVGVADRGVYKSVNAGAAWTQLYAWGAVEGAFVNTGFPEQIYAVSKGSAQVRVSKDGGASWITDVASEPMPGEYRSAYQTYIGNNEPNVLPDPRDKGRATAFANAKFFQTDNGGENWMPANAYFCGVHHKNYAAPQSFDPKNPQRYVLGMLDVGVLYTEDGGRTFEHPRIDKAALGLSWTSVNGIALHPVASEKIVLACVGRETKGTLLRSTDNGANWTVASGGDEPRHWIGFDAGNPNYAYQWRERSSNKGASWTPLASMPPDAVIVGISRAADPQTGNSVLYALRPKPFQNPSPVWRSRDRGNTWQEVFRPTWKLNSPADQQVTFRVHPADPFTVFTRSANRQIRRWTLDAAGKVTATTDFDVFAGRPAPGDFDASNFAVDARNPAVMYVRNSQGGGSYDGNFLFMTTDAGASWQNISEGLSNSGGNGLEVHPVTGVLYIGTTNGMYVRRPADPAPTVPGTFALLGQAYPDWDTGHINQPY